MHFGGGPKPTKAEEKRRSTAVLEAQKEFGDNISAISRATKLARASVREYLRKGGAYKDKPVAGGTADHRSPKRLPPPKKGAIKRYLLTAAQNNTHVHDAFWRNLTAFAAEFSAEIHVSRFTYNKNAFAQAEVKPDSKSASDYDDLWYDERLAPFYSDEPLQLAPGLVWCGEMNILPTAVRPLSGFETYTGRNSGIFPHVKIALESIVAMAGEGTKFNYTTGAVTLRNYIQKKAGLKADFHHAFGALLVEVDDAGTWFCRQINASNDGTFYDLNVRVQKGRVTAGHRVAAINWGDTHAAETDQTVEKLAWGEGGMLDVLRPFDQFHNDLFSMRGRGHHDMKNCHTMFKRYVAGDDNVERELDRTAALLGICRRKWCRTVVVDSNHDQHLTRWLREADHKADPVNAQFYLKAQARLYNAIAAKDDNFHLLEWALREFDCPKDVRFLRQDEAYIICDEAGGGIECGMHGDLGPNGSRGSIRGISKLGRKANIGHSHSAGIHDGIYQAGTSSRLRLEYTKGPSSWSHSHIVTYRSGKRAIVCMYAGKWRA